MTEFGKLVMGEIVAATGCRPVVVRRLTVGSYVDKVPGFSPYQVTADDCVVDEERNNVKIYRRVNPNLPPKNQGCIHQRLHQAAVCPNHCDDRCDPVGFNIYVDWDKTQGVKGPSYLHLPKPIKTLCDCYDIVRSKFFEGRKLSSTHTGDADSWLHDVDTTFFINSAGSSFVFLDLKHITEALGQDVTAYDYRRIVATWAINHDSEEIREAEEEALQHGVRIAKEKYQQNKMLKPQMLTQAYVNEENLFPIKIREEIEQTEEEFRSQIKETEEKRVEQRYQNLVKEKEENRKLKDQNRPLGPRNRILRSTKEQFRLLIEELQTLKIKELLKMKPLLWRKTIVRTVCIGSGETGDNLRKVWISIYKGRVFTLCGKVWPRI